VLEEKLGRPVTAICYPAGSFNDAVVAVAAEAGYRAGFTTQPGFGSVGLVGDEIYRLRRLSMYGENECQADLHIAKLALKRLFFGKKWV
jgi:peptidoglycan/xylan/chitin deacetylase (PgdA/CDA1 family)